ncbi:MAG: 16S rRNA (cytidine(1402)-2'-O)-methyltransferase [Propionibacteriales bacterium]|nr:16S rRNA (cytidine(1402)-2'-O)-methyltransferase [Propionibacteriales bacterium]
MSIREGGALVLAATPIGDSSDASPRLLTELVGANVIAAEDTRRLHGLSQRLGITITGRVVSYFEGNEAARTPGLVDEIAAGQRVLLVTDAGMPSVSDPGYRLVTAVIEAGLPVTAVPGPSAVLTALALSGLPVDRFAFEGFAPRKSAERRRRLAEVADDPRTTIWFEAPHRVAAFLSDATEVIGADRPAAVCRELTKTYEEVRRGPLVELAEWAADGVRGEITVVIAPAPAADVDLGQAVARVAELTAAGERTKPAVAAVAAETGIAKNLLYDAVLEARRS